jgi:nucleotide-binding universal stress UspA family protein
MKIESNAQADVVFHQIVVPHDLTARCDRAVQLAGTMAHPLRSEVVLIHVIDPGDRCEKESVPSMSPAVDLARDQWRLLQIAAKRLLPADVKFDVRILSGDPQNVILTEARKLGADLLIITTHPVTGAGYPFGGGKVEPIQDKAPCPVLDIEVSDEDETSLAEQETRKFETHNLKQYCELSRHLSEKHSHRPVYIGYSRLPADPSGVCH